MKVTITITTGNAAFEDGDGYAEVARILADRAARIERDGSVEDGKLMDYNGNTVGQIKVTGRRSR